MRSGAESKGAEASGDAGAEASGRAKAKAKATGKDGDEPPGAVASDGAGG